MTARYRPDIDGLRAIAILAVVAFHVGLPGMRFGFMGVDIFFVISGYLITGILLRESETRGRIDLVDFYVRRIRRLVPALTVMILGVLAAGIAILPADGERQDLAKAAMAAAGFLANIHGLTAQAGYFARTAYTLPLLHTWTLAVEEQFYLVWPFAIIIAGWIAKRLGLPAGRILAAALTLGSLVSFGLGLWLAEHRPEAGFFLPFSRAWEFAVGAILALPAVGRILARRGSWLAWIGSVLLLLAPGLYLCGLAPGAQAYSALALVPPVLGAGFLIAAGSRVQTSLPSRLLASPPLVALGKVSYGWYLWHWPLLALARMNDLGRNDLTRDLILAVISLALAIASWFWIEQPARGSRRSPLRTRSGALVWGGGLLIGCFVAGWATLATANHQLRTGTSEQARRWRMVDAAQPLTLSLPKACDSYGLTRLAPTELCLRGDRTARKMVMVWGDSHARQYAPALMRAGRQHGFAVLPRIRSGCRVTGESEQHAADCGAFNKAVLAQLPDLAKSHDLGGVMIGGNWPGDARWRSALEATVDDLTQRGLRVVIVMDNINFPGQPPACFARRGEAGCGLSRAAVEQHRLKVRQALEAIAAGRPQVRIMDALDEVCSADRCPASGPEGLLYFDPNHLTQAASERYVSALADQANWLLSR